VNQVRPARRHVAVRRLFALRLGERLTVDDVARGLPRSSYHDLRRALGHLLEEGWLRTGHREDHKTVWWLDD
jgi:hypothetical protein